jgi:hypothetical protein
MSLQSQSESLKHFPKIESHRIFISIESALPSISGLVVWKLGLLHSFRDSEDGSEWKTKLPDRNLRKSELAAKADVVISENETLDSLINKIKETAWSVDSHCSVYLTVFFLEKAPFTFYSFPAKNG